MKREHAQLSYLTFKKNKKSMESLSIVQLWKLYSSSKALAHSYPS